MEVDIEQYHDAIINALKLEFASRVNTIDRYEPNQENPIDTPAILLEMEYADEGFDQGDDKIPLSCKMTLHVLLGNQTPNIKLEIRKFAVQVFVLVRSNQFGLSDVEIPSGLNMGPGDFKVGKHGYEGWFISWDQNIFLGSSVWEPTGFVPQTVFVGHSPDVGIDPNTYDEVTE